MPDLLLNPVNLVLAVVATVAIVLCLSEYHKRKVWEEKGWDILHEAQKKSQDILAEAELEGIKGEAQLIQESKQTIAKAQDQLLTFMKDLQTRSAEFEEAQKKAGQERINELFDRIEQRLSEFLIQTGQQTTSSIELELKSVRQLIETYKNEQLKLIDDNIVAMMEQTLNLVLAKKLSLKDQLDLIYEALEKARIEKFVV